MPKAHSRVASFSEHRFKSYQMHAETAGHKHMVQLMGRPAWPLDLFVQPASDSIVSRAVPDPMANNESIVWRQVFLLLSTFQHNGTVADFVHKMKEQHVLSVGSVGGEVAFKSIAQRIGRAALKVLQGRLREELSEATEIALSADEPKGVDRVGIRVTFVADNTLKRRFLKLAELKSGVSAGGEAYGARSHQGI